MIGFHQQLTGRFKIESVKLDDGGNEIKGTRRELAPWFQNMILDQGLDKYGTTSTWFDYCHVGSGSTAPSAGQTALVTFVAGTGNLVGSPTNVAAGSAPYYLAATRVFRFNAGTATGNLTEVGIGSASSTGNLFSRALILDGGGSPTTITVLADETLDVTYEFRCYAPPSDVTGTITLDSVSYDWTLRACNVTTTQPDYGWVAPDDAGLGGSGYDIRTGAIGAITASPGGTTLVPPNPTGSNASYSAGTFYRDLTVTVGLSAGNHASGIGSLRFKAGIGTYQVGFVPNIPKTSSQTLTLTFRHSWARKTL